MKAGGKRLGAGRKKSAPTKTKSFRISLELDNELKKIKGLNKLVNELLENLINKNTINMEYIEENIEIGKHFWAILHDELIVLVKTSKDEYAMCSYWEGSVKFSEFKILEFIEMPIEFKKYNLYIN